MLPVADDVRRDLWANYLSEVAFTDGQLGRVLDPVIQSAMCDVIVQRGALESDVNTAILTTRQVSSTLLANFIDVSRLRTIPTMPPVQPPGLLYLALSGGTP